MILSSLIEESFQRNQRSLEEGALKNSLLGAGLGATALGAAGIYDDVHMDNLEHTSQIHDALHHNDNGIYKDGKIDNSKIDKVMNKWNNSSDHDHQQFKKPEELKQFAQQNEKDFNANKDEINKAKNDKFQSHYDHLKNWINGDDKVGKHTAMYGAAAIGGGATLGAILGRRR